MSWAVPTFIAANGLPASASGLSPKSLPTSAAKPAEMAAASAAMPRAMPHQSRVVKILRISEVIAPPISCSPLPWR